MNNENLVKLDHDRAVEIGRKGGKRSAEVRRQKKTMRESLELLLSLPVTSGDIADELRELGIKDEDLTNVMALCIKVFQKALNGDIKAAEFIRDTIGEKPELQVNANMRTSDSPKIIICGSEKQGTE